MGLIYHFGTYEYPPLRNPDKFANLFEEVCYDIQRAETHPLQIFCSSFVNREHSELQLLCRYNSCKAVADNGEWWKTAFRITRKSRLTSLIQWIQESGRVSELKLLSFYIDF